MTSALPDTARALLRTLGFDFVKTDRAGLEHWLSDEQLPHILLKLDPAEKPAVPDIIRAIHAAGASDQRDRTREAWNRCANTFRNGMSVQSPDDILSLSESPPLPVSQSPSLPP